MTITCAIGISNGKYYCSMWKKKQFPLTDEGANQLAHAIYKKAKGEYVNAFCSSSIDFPEEEGGKKGIDYSIPVCQKLNELQYGESKIPLAILYCEKCEKYHLYSIEECKDDMEKFDDSQDAANFFKRGVHYYDLDELAYIIIEPEKTFPESLINDKTKIGKQSILVHKAIDDRLFLSLDNGILTLSTDGTWEWQERT